MTIDNLSDLTQYLKTLADEKKNSDKIELHGLAQFKKNLFKIDQILDFEKPTELIKQLNDKENELLKVLEEFEEEDRKSLINSLHTSYYTPKEVVSNISEIFNETIIPKLKAQNSTFNTLEPSGGSGNFLNTLLLENVDVVEKDSITYSILQQNVQNQHFKQIPNIQTFHKKFEDFKTTKEYNLIIGNIPFGTIDVFDPTMIKQYPLFKNRIHNYFFLKSIQLTKANGIIALITTSGTQNNPSDLAFRQEVLKNTSVISMTRLHEDTFKNAKTKVIADFIILQKREQPLKELINLTNKDQSFLETISITKDNYHNYSEEIEGLKAFFEKEENQKNSFNYSAAFIGKNVIGQKYITTGYAGKPIISVKSSSNDISLKEQLQKDTKQIAFPTGLDASKNKSTLKQPPSTKKNSISIPNTAPLDLFSVPVYEDKKETDFVQIAQDLYISFPLAIAGNLVYHKDSVYKLKEIELSKDYPNGLFPEQIPFSILDIEKIKSIVDLRETYKEYIHVKRQDLADPIAVPLLKNKLEKLNEVYDVFYFKFNHLHDKTNKHIINLDEQRHVLLNLEYYDLNKKYYRKADLFEESFTIKNIANNKLALDDAIIKSFNDKGKIDIPYISNLTDIPDAVWIKKALEAQSLFLNINFNEQQNTIKDIFLSSKEEFRSGYVEDKIHAYSNFSHYFINNKEHKDPFNIASIINKGIISNALDTLQEVIPVKLTIEDIDPNLGEPWINVSVYNDFAKEHFGLDNYNLRYYDSADKYVVNSRTNYTSDEIYGVQKQRGYINHNNILLYALAQNIPHFTKTIYRDDKEIKVVDKEVINKVTFSVNKLNEEFTLWLKKDKALCQKLENIYHRKYNAYVKEKINASHIDFKPLYFTPRDYQTQAAWQMVKNEGGIIDHEVGFGKSLTMAMAASMRLKLGISKREIITGLNANYESLYQLIKKAYPDIPTLLINPKDLEPKKGQSTFLKIINNDYKIIVMPHSTLKKLPISPLAVSQVNEDIIKEAEQTIMLNKEEGFLSLREKNSLLKKLEKAEVDYKYAQSILNHKKNDGFIVFEDLGIDFISVDESQYFKNLSYETVHTRVAGLNSTAGSQKNTNFLSYIRSIQNRRGNKDTGITFASGTTIANSITEMYTIFKYLRPEALKKQDIHSFDQWARLFARKSTEFEESVGNEIKSKERFRFFVKVPELSKFYNDITHYADFNTHPIDRPELKSIMTTIEPFKKQKKYFENIRHFAKTKDPSGLIGVAAGEGSKKAVGLICTSQGKKASLDLRLIHPQLGDHPDNKINTMARKAFHYYEKFKDSKGTQVIFLDQGTPGTNNFNLYQAIKDVFTQNYNIPENEVAFIHDYKTSKKRENLFDLMNKGEKRILIGSTEKTGVGVNIQERLIAMHHLDFPWRPTDLDQRNGRGGRPGNLLAKNSNNNKVNTHYYAVKGSVDAYIFNVLLNKQRFILQLKNASLGSRKIDEGMVDNDGNLNLEGFIAATSENPLLTEKLKIERELLKYDQQYKAYTQRQQSLNFSIRGLEQKIEKDTANLHKFLADKETLEKYHINLKVNEDNDLASFSKIKIGADRFFDPISLGKYLNIKTTAFFDQLNPKSNTSLVTFDNGFELVVFKKDPDLDLNNNNYKILVRTPNNLLLGYKSNTFTKKEKEIGLYFFNAVARLSNLIASHRSNISDNKSKIETFNIEKNKSFSNEDKRLELQSKIDKINKEIENSKNPKKENKNENKGPKL